MKKLLLLAGLFASMSTLTIKAQITIGALQPPDSSALLDLTQGATTTKGLLLPRVALVNINDAAPLKDHVQGMYVYNLTVDQANGLFEGTYFNNGTQWVRVQNDQSNPWVSVETGNAATDPGEQIYRSGQIGVGTSTIDSSAMMEVSSNQAGVLIPRLSARQRDGILNPANGLLIFNTTTNCINYYDKTIPRWLSLCGDTGPAKLALLDCNFPVGPQGDYMEGRALSIDNTYTLSVKVIEVGSYEIVAKTANGYAYTKKGVFTTHGNYQIVLDGQGVPLQAQTDVISSVTINGVLVNSDCTLPSITVSPASLTFTVDCSKTTVYGTYLIGNAVDMTNYVTIQANVTTAGTTIIQTTSANGITFSSGSVELEVGVQTIKLYASGTPSAFGAFAYQFTIGGAQCTFTVDTGTTLGTHANPATRCQAIADQNPTAVDGYYWIVAGGNATAPLLTQCEFTPDGAWTLIKSISEYAIFVTDKTQAESIASQKARGNVTTTSEVFNEYYFTLPGTTVVAIGNAQGTETRQYKFNIKEHGHTTAIGRTQEDVASTTVSTKDDIWAMDNYWIVTCLTGNLATGNYSSTAANNTSDGKLFGAQFGKPSTDNTQHFFDGVAFTTNPPNIYSQANFFTGFYGAFGYAGTTSQLFTYTYHDSSDAGNGLTFTFSRADINDLFGLYMNSEAQLNHHIGTCSNSQDDFGGTARCSAGWANWRPHKFNQRPDNDYEGRILQVWVR